MTWTWRRRFSVLTVAVTAILISWGGFVTSIQAGMAFPDWPTSLGSYNLINPVEGWWKITPYLAEHGHRLIASLVGILTVALAGWTWLVDPRRWMRRLGLAAVGLVVLQGILGGLRVVWVSLDLAVVHACVAQLFFALLVAMTLFTTRTWREGRGILPASDAAARLQRLAGITAGAIYLQILLGALLRHPGRGIDGAFATVHIAGAFVVVGLVVAVFLVVYKHFDDVPAIRKSGTVLIGTVGVQFALGLAAFIIMLYETSQGIQSVLQVGLTIGHLIIGSVLFAASVVLTLLARRRTEPSTAAPLAGAASGDAVGRPAAEPEPSLARADD